MQRIFAILLCSVTVLTAAACNKSYTVSSLNDSTSTESSSIEAASSEETETCTIDAFVDELRSDIDDMNETFSESGLNINVIAKENSLVYRYQYIEAVANIETAKEAAESTVNSQDEVFENLLTMVKTAVPDAEAVVVEYLNADGSTIFAKEYK